MGHVIWVVIYIIYLIIRGIILLIRKLANKAKPLKHEAFKGTVAYRDLDANDRGHLAAKKKVGRNYIDISPNQQERKCAMPAPAGKAPSGARIVLCPACQKANLLSSYEKTELYYCSFCGADLEESVTN